VSSGRVIDRARLGGLRHRYDRTAQKKRKIGSLPWEIPGQARLSVMEQDYPTLQAANFLNQFSMRKASSGVCAYRLTFWRRGVRYLCVTRWAAWSNMQGNTALIASDFEATALAGEKGTQWPTVFTRR
jgi:hypothetical protein